MVDKVRTRARSLKACAGNEDQVLSVGLVLPAGAGFKRARNVGLRRGRLMGVGRAVARGFTLIEMAIVLVVIGLMLSGGLLAITPTINAAKARDTNARLDQIEQALLVYAIRNSCIPCPANGTLGTPVGLAGGTPVTDTYSTGCVDTHGGACAAGTNGVVPWGTLGLSQNEATDGWGNLISYIVSASAVTDDDMERNGTTYPAGTLVVRDAGPGGTPVGTVITTAAAYVLVSHGRDGAGALTPAGSTISGRAVAGNTVQTDNAAGLCNAGTPCHQANNIEIDDATYFDDITRWRSAPIVIQLCGSSACGNPA